MRELSELERKVLDELKKVKDPETGSDIVSLGLVYGLTVKESYAEVWVEFSKRLSVCPFCKALGWLLIRRISRDIINRLRQAGFSVVKVVDSLNPSIEYGEEEE